MAQAPPTTTLPRKVWTVTKTGSLAGLRLDDDVIAAPGPGEVRITVKAVGLNFADVFSVLGKYFPFTTFHFRRLIAHTRLTLSFLSLRFVPSHTPNSFRAGAGAVRRG